MVIANKEDDKMGIVYLAKNVINRKCYIGKTIGEMNDRKKSHKQDASKGSPLVFHRALRKYGFDAFEWKVLMTEDNKDDLNESEITCIKMLKTKLPDGYNMTDGGEGGDCSSGIVRSKETRKKLSEARKGMKQTAAMKRASAEHSIRMSGRKKTKETRKKLSVALTGRVFTEEHCKNLSAAWMGVNKGKTYEEMYGEEKAAELKKRRSEQRLGYKFSEETKAHWSKIRKGRTYEEMYGKERAEKERSKRRKKVRV